MRRKAMACGMPRIEGREDAWGIAGEDVSERRLRLWETPNDDAGMDRAERLGVPPLEPLTTVGIALESDAGGFTAVSSSGSDHSVLITLMARAGGADEREARARLRMLTSPDAAVGVPHVDAAEATSAYRRLWFDDIETHTRAAGDVTATRSGAVVVPLPAGGSYRLAHQPAALEHGVVVAAVAAVGVGLEGPLIPVERGASASIGERPVLPR